MKIRIAFLIAGVVLGFYLRAALERPAPREASVTESDVRSESVPVALTVPETSKPAPIQRAILQDSGSRKFELLAARPEQKLRAPQEDQKSFGLHLEEEVVQELEQEKELLRDHAYTELQQDGWRVHILSEDRALLNSGLRDGDVITQESLSAEMAKPDRAALAGRFVSLLKYMEK